MRNERQIPDQLHKWAEDQDQIRAMLLTGSRANPDSTTDILSDYDIELFVNDLQPFAQSDAWLDVFGPMLVRWPLKPTVSKDGWITRLVIFGDGLRIDFQISTIESLQQWLDDPELAAPYDNGYKILLDKDHHIKNPKPPTYMAYVPAKPTSDEFETLVNDFWWDIIYVAKSLWRDELFYAKYVLDFGIRFSCLQKMIEWYIGAGHDWKVNPNKYGRYFKKYLDKKTWKEIEATFTGAGINDNWIALFKMTELFRRLSIEVGNRLGYPYHRQDDKKVTEYLLKIKNLGENSEHFMR